MVPNPCPYMYRLDSVGFWTFPNRPLACCRWGERNQLTAFWIWSEYLPSLSVLPSIKKHMPARAVMVVGYCPPWASQCPSWAWVRLSHSRPFSTESSTRFFRSSLAFFSWAGTGPGTATTAARIPAVATTASNQLRRMAPSESDKESPSAGAGAVGDMEKDEPRVEK